jgi:OHCU decarboxylase
MTLGELNACDEEGFVAALGAVAEGSPWVARDAFGGRPFADVEAVAGAFAAAIEAAPPARQLALVRAHPDLAGRLATAGALGALSAGEQAGAGLDRLTPDELAAFTALNTAYRDRFGFPFVICVRDHTRATILASFRERLAHGPDEERRAALVEITRIVRLRLEELVG